MKKVILIALAAAMLLGTVACKGSGASSQETTVAETTVAETTEEPTTEEPTTEEPTTEEPITEKPTEPPTEKPTEPLYYTTGQTYEDGALDVTFVSAETYTGYDEYTAPENGKRVIRAYFEITNSGSSSIGVGSWDFDCYADNETVDTYYCLEDNAEELDAYVDLSKGRTVKGYIYYEVPENAKDIEIEYTPVDAGFFDDDDPVVFKVQ